MATKTAPKTSVVPRPGCKNTNSAGTDKMQRALRKTMCSPMGFSATFPASTTTRPGLANFEGCT
jgi:hypothetical protein